MIFVDASAWIAAFFRGDEFHGPGRSTLVGLREENRSLCTSDLVLAEALEWIANAMPRVSRKQGIPTTNKQGYEESLRLADLVFSLERLKVLRLDTALERKALDKFRDLQCRKIGWVDCTSFALMEAHRIRTAFTFDQHFEAGGFQVIPAPRSKQAKA